MTASHLLCRDCGTIGDVDATLRPSVLREAEQASGFEVTAGEGEFAGRCPACRA